MKYKYNPLASSQVVFKQLQGMQSPMYNSAIQTVQNPITQGIFETGGNLYNDESGFTSYIGKQQVQQVDQFFRQQGWNDMDIIIQEPDFCLYLGNYSAAVNVQKLKKNNIKGVLTVLGKAGLNYNSGSKIEHHRVFHIEDLETQDIKQYFEEGIEFIEKCRQNKVNVLVHCFAGISRSATIVIAYLMKIRGMSFIQALTHCQSRRRCVNPNKGFTRQLINLEFELKVAQDKYNRSQGYQNQYTNSGINQRASLQPQGMQSQYNQLGQSQVLLRSQFQSHPQLMQNNQQQMALKMVRNQSNKEGEHQKKPSLSNSQMMHLTNPKFQHQNGTPTTINKYGQLNYHYGQNGYLSYPQVQFQHRNFNQRYSQQNQIYI